MSEFTKALLVASIFRYVLVIAGVVFAYMGYRLFILGYFEKAGELRAAFGNNHIILKQVAPGVFFALLGVATIAVGVYRGMEIKVPMGNSGDLRTAQYTNMAGQTSNAQVSPCTDKSDAEFIGTQRSSKQPTNKPAQVIVPPSQKTVTKNQ